MVWVILFSLIVFLLGGVPFAVGVRFQQEREARRLSFKSLASATGTYDRSELKQRFGDPDDDDCYAVSAEFADECARLHSLAGTLPQTWWFLLLNANATSYACLAGACMSLWLMVDHPSIAWWIAGIAAACQIARWTVAVRSIGVGTLSEICELCDD